MNGLEKLVLKGTMEGSFPELGVKLKMTDLVKLGREYLSMFEQKMLKTEDETKMLILQSQYNTIFEFFGKYLNNENS